jgi:hypothetical protein
MLRLRKNYITITVKLYLCIFSSVFRAVFFSVIFPSAHFTSYYDKVYLNSQVMITSNNKVYVMLLLKKNGWVLLVLVVWTISKGTKYMTREVTKNSLLIFQ